MKKGKKLNVAEDILHKKTDNVAREDYCRAGY